MTELKVDPNPTPVDRRRYKMIKYAQTISIKDDKILDSSMLSRSSKITGDPEAFLKQAYSDYAIIGKSKRGNVQYYCLHAIDGIDETIATVGFIEIR